MGLSGGGDNFASCCFFGITWRILLLPVLLEALGDIFASCSFGGTFWETIFLVEGYLLFVFLSFCSIWLIVK
jgi:hypothetical protein